MKKFSIFSVVSCVRKINFGAVLLMSRLPWGDRGSPERKPWKQDISVGRNPHRNRQVTATKICASLQVPSFMPKSS